MEEKPKRPPRKKPAARRPARKARPGGTNKQPGAPPEETPAAAADEAAPVVEPTTVLPVAEEPTTVLPAAEEATTVLPAAGEPTSIMPAAGQPTGYAPLSATAVVARSRDSRPVPWLIVAVAAVAIAAVVLMWVLVSGGGDPDAFLGTWARTPDLGGGLVVEEDGDQVMVTWYDGQLNAQGPLSASVDGDVLEFELPDLDGSGVRRATLTTTDDADVLRLMLAGASGLVRRAANLTPATAAPTPAPSSSPTPTAAPSPVPSASGSPSASPSTSGSPSPSPSASGSDQAVIDATLALNAAILQYAATHGNVFPPPSDVSQSGAVGQSMSTWPTNSYTGLAMKAGAQPGDYVYEQLQDGKDYRLTAYLSGGFTYPAH